MAKDAATARSLNPVLLTGMTLAMIAGVTLSPTLAASGPSALTIIAICAVIMLIPTSLVAAELGTGWPHDGGVYLWVRSAFGPRLGFVAIWLQWLDQMIFLPTSLAFVAATAAYIGGDTALANNRFYLVAVIVAIIWIATLVNMLGLRESGRFGTVGIVIATIIPSLIIIGLAVAFVSSDGSTEVSFAVSNWIPTGSQLTFFVTGINAYVAIEVTAAFVRRIKNPSKDYPRALLGAGLIDFVLLFFVTFAIMIAVPKSQLSAVSGFMETYDYLLGDFGLSKLLPIIAAMIALGWVGRVTNIFIGPATSLLTSARFGHLPEFLTVENSRSAPRNLLLVQAVIATVAAAPFAFLPDPSTAFVMLATLAVSLYLVMYLLMFAAAIKLRYSHPGIKRPFRVPGGKAGMWIVAGVGFGASIFALAVGLKRPDDLSVESVLWGAVVGGGLILGVVLGFAIDRGVKKPPETDVDHARRVTDADGEVFLDDTADQPMLDDPMHRAERHKHKPASDPQAMSTRKADPKSRSTDASDRDKRS